MISSAMPSYDVMSFLVPRLTCGLVTFVFVILYLNEISFSCDDQSFSLTDCKHCVDTIYTKTLALGVHSLVKNIMIADVIHIHLNASSSSLSFYH